VPALKRLLEPATRGDPMRPLLWVSKSMDKLAVILTGMGHPISADTVRKELVKLGFSRQYNRRGRLEASGPERTVRAHQCESRGRSGRRRTADARRGVRKTMIVALAHLRQDLRKLLQCKERSGGKAGSFTLRRL